jgi:glycosyltransferase involved in cell wall biosynthesis
MPPLAERILIDGTMARGGGGFTYLANLVPQLSALAPDRRFRVELISPRLCDALAPLPGVEARLRRGSGVLARSRSACFDLARVATRFRADLLLVAGESPPLGVGCPSVASFRNPNVFTSLDQGWGAYQTFRLGLLRAMASRAARRCERILFVSADSARWIGDGLRLPPERRAVIHHGIDRQRFAPGAARPRREPYLLSVSTVYRYKNFVRLIEAWTLLARRSAIPDLVIIGDVVDVAHGREMRRARDAAGSLAGRIHLLGAVPYEQLPGWYAAAELFVFPSYLETFGHPLLEAMASGVPVVASDMPVFHEVAGEAAMFVDPHNTDSLAKSMEAVLSDVSLRSRLVEHGRRRAELFTWEASARRHLELFDAVVAGAAR